MNIDHTLPDSIDFKYSNTFYDFFNQNSTLSNKRSITEQEIRKMIDTVVKSYLKEIEIRLGVIENKQLQIQPSFRTSACPVCRGTGNVVAGFYSLFGGSSSSAFETCRSCNGKGYIII